MQDKILILFWSYFKYDNPDEKLTILYLTKFVK